MKPKATLISFNHDGSFAGRATYLRVKDAHRAASHAHSLTGHWVIQTPCKTHFSPSCPQSIIEGYQ